MFLNDEYEIGTIRAHRSTTWPIVTDGVAWSVGLSVCHDREPCKNGWTDQDAVWDVDSGGFKEALLDGVHTDATW